MNDNYIGKAIILGDNINSEIIHPAKYFSLNEEIVKSGCFMGLEEALRNKILYNKSIIFAGNNFGCGSSREVIIQSLKYNRIDIIFAKSFARIFYRNCINNNILCIPFDYNLAKIENNNDIKYSLSCNKLENLSKNNYIKLSNNINDLLEIISYYEVLLAET